MHCLHELRRAITDKVFWLIVGAGVLGVAGQPLVLVGLLAVLLTLWSCVSDEHWFDAFKRVGRLDALAYFWLRTNSRASAWSRVSERPTPPQ